MPVRILPAAASESCFPRMSPRPSPATLLHDVVVVHDQSGTEWRVAKATIDGGRIVIRSAADRPPAGIFANPKSTYTIAALDGGDRTRRYANVTLDQASTMPRRQYVFA
jgi:hypothetical protein